MLLLKAIMFASCFSFTPTDRPHLAPAQAIVESGGNQFARGKHGEHGAYQVISKHWGKVPYGLWAQTEQYENIMNDLVASHKKVDKAIMKYNGSGPATIIYLAKVRKKCLEIAITGV